MPKKWSDVAASAAFQSLSFEEQEEARQQYFSEVVAPQVGDDIDTARMQFDADTAIKRPAPRPAVAPQPALEQPSFWGEVGNVLTSAKDYVADTFKDKPESVMDNYVAPKPATSTKIEELGAPVTDAYYDKVRKSYASADSKTRLEMEAQPNLTGQVARGLQEKAQAMPEASKLAEKRMGEKFTIGEQADETRRVASQDRTIGETAGDLGRDISMGVMQLFEMPANIISPDSEYAETLRGVRRELQDENSEISKARQAIMYEKIANEDGFVDKYVTTLSSLVMDPSLAVSEVVKQLPNLYAITRVAKLGAMAGAGAVNLAGRASPTLAIGEAISGGALAARGAQVGATAGGVGSSVVLTAGDAAGSTYEALTDPNVTPTSTWRDNPDFQRLVASGMSETDAIKSVAKDKAQLAGLMAAPLGVLGFMGAEASIVSRGLAGRAGTAITGKEFGKVLGKELVTEQIEEGGTQLSSNIMQRTVNPNVKLDEGVAQAMATAAVAAGGITAATNAAPLIRNFTPADSLSAEMGLSPIVVPTVTRQGGQDVSRDSNAPGLAADSGRPAGIDFNGSLEGAGLPPLSERGGLGPIPGGVNAAAGPAGLVQPGASEQPAPVTLPRLADRASDNDLLARVQGILPPVQDEIAAPAPAPVPAQPTTVMMSRAGTGYATQQDATVAMQVGMKREPDMDWKIEPIEGDRFRVAAYARAADPVAAPVAPTPAAPTPTLAEVPAMPARAEVAAPATPTSEWAAFTPDTGTLGIPRAEMPQIKAEHRGAMVNFLNARGVTHTSEEVQADTLKPTQAEFSTEKVAKARDYTGGDRSILISSDNHVLDGHHQWLAKKEAGEPVKVIRLNAPIAELLTTVKEFPSATLDESTAVPAPANVTPATPEPILPPSGKPFSTPKMADVYARTNKIADYEAVQVDGGWAIQPATPTAPAAEITMPEMAAPAAQAAPIVQASGEPFKTEKGAMLYAKQQGIPAPVTVAYKGGFAIAPQETTNGTAGPASTAAAGGLGGAGVSSAPLLDASDTGGTGSVDPRSARRTAQAAIDLQAGSGKTQPLQIGEPLPEDEAAIQEISNIFGSTFGAGKPIVAFSSDDPSAPNGLTIGRVAFVNTSTMQFDPKTGANVDTGAVDVSAPRTALHEFKHVVEQIAAAEARAGQTNTPAQQFTASIDSIFDDMTDDGKRAYIENFLHADELAGMDEVRRETRIQNLMNKPMTRSEMTADFLGNRAQDKEFWKLLAARDPKGFKGFVEKWLGIISNLTAKLRGSKTQGKKESARVDGYVRDLGKAKMVAMDALIAYRKGVGAAVADTALPTSERTKAPVEKEAALRAQLETARANAAARSSAVSLEVGATKNTVDNQNAQQEEIENGATGGKETAASNDDRDRPASAIRDRILAQPLQGIGEGNRDTAEKAVGDGDIQFSLRDPRTRTIEVDGVRRPIENSKGQKVGANFKEQAAFWRWFGDSAVVDSQGRPLVVYHGTNGDISTFDLARAEESQAGQISGVPGFYFGISPDTADRYASGESRNIMPSYLSLKNPAELDYAQLIGGTYTREDLETQGYDGAIVNKRGKPWSYIAFYPEQIKSTTGNAGTFDPENADIRFSKREAPPVTIANDLGAAKNLPGYQAAKAGDSESAVDVALALVTEDLLAEIEQMAGDSNPIIQPVYAIESAGRNRIPLASAEVISVRLGLDVGQEIVQSDSPKRTSMVGLERVFHRPAFNGSVEAGRSYILLDDTVTQGGTFAALEQHIVDGGSKVIGSIALTGKSYSSKLKLSNETLSKLRAAHGQVENEFRAETGYGFDELTESEARYLASYKPASAVRDRITSGRLSNGTAKDAPDDLGEVQLSRRQPPVIITPANARHYQLAPETRTRAARRNLQDYFLRVKEVQEVVAAQGGTVNEQQDVYQAETLSYGRMQEQIRDFKEKVVQPLLEDVQKRGLSLSDLALYAYALHAPERNAAMQKINPKLPDGTGSGMTDDEAAEILAAAKAEGYEADLKELHGKLLAITKSTRDLLLRDGLITQDEYDAWTGAYQNYVPLRGFVEEETDEVEGRPVRGMKVGGKGFNIRGAESVKALGRTSMAGHVIENIVNDYERAVARAERNEVAKVFLNLVTTNPDANLWEIDTLRTTASFSKKDQVVTYNQLIDKGEDTISVKLAGKEVYIKVKDEILLRAMKQAGKDDTGATTRILMKSLGWYTAFMRNVLTRYNPAFGAMNAVKDFGFGAVSALADLGPKGMALYSKNYMTSLGANFRAEIGRTDLSKAIDRQYEEFRASGATTGGWHMRDLQEMRKELSNLMVEFGAEPQTAAQKLIATRGLKQAYSGSKKIFRMLELVGALSENQARFAAYRAARELGKSPAAAGKVAKELTTNFNRKGEWGSAMNTSYLFFNAGVQGSAKMLGNLKSKKVQALMGGMVGLTTGLALMGAAVGGDDDDGEAFWDKIPQFEKERNLIIMLPPAEGLEGAERIGNKGRYLKIPVQYGLNVFTTLGYTLADLARYAANPLRGKSPGRAAINTVSSMATSFNPLGGAVDLSDPVSIGMAVAPSIADVGIQFGANVDGFGRPTSPKRSPFDKNPDSENFGPALAGTWEQRLARWMNEKSGGDEAVSGAIDLAPGTVRNLKKNMTGGTGDFISSVFVNIPTKMMSPEAEIGFRDMPVVKGFYGRVDDNIDMGLYYERRAEVLDAAEAAGRRAKMGIEFDYDEKSLGLQSLGEAAKQYTKAMTALKRAEMQLIEDVETPKAQRDLEIKEIKKEQAALARDFNAAYMGMKREVVAGGFK